MTIRVATVEGDEDHDATWLLGHTERIEFGPLVERDGELWCDASIHVPCRFLATGADNRTSRCTAHGFAGRLAPVSHTPAARRLGTNRFAIVDHKRLTTRKLEAPPASRRPLPLAPTPNPCAGTPCRTSDNKRGDACCRDIEVDICCTEQQTMLEALICSRKSPYLCKPVRENSDLIVVEIISACGFLKDEGGCDLHGRTRADGRPAKPVMCSHWPDKRTGLHPGCAFRSRKVPL